MSAQALASILALVTTFASGTPLAVVAPTAGPANPPVVANDPPKLNPCRTAAADREATLTAGLASASVSSSGIPYGSSWRSCRRFIGELHVPSDARGPQSGLGGSTPYYKLRPGLVHSPNQQTCAQTSLTVDAYLKAAGSNSFALQTRLRYVGVWDGASFVPQCRLTLVEGSAPQREPNDAGDETWRVVMSAERGDLPLGVTAHLAFDAVPY